MQTSFKELGFKVGHFLFFLVEIVHFQLQSEAEVLSLGKLPGWMRVQGGHFKPQKRGTDLETKLLKVNRISRTKFIYLVLPNFRFITGIRV